MSEDDNITKVEPSFSKTVTGFESSPGEVPKVELSSAKGISESKRSPEEVTIVEPSSSKTLTEFESSPEKVTKVELGSVTDDFQSASVRALTVPLPYDSPHGQVNIPEFQDWANTSKVFEDFNDFSVTDPCKIAKILSEKVHKKEEFFLVSRRCAPLTRTLVL